MVLAKQLFKWKVDVSVGKLAVLQGPLNLKGNIYINGLVEGDVNIQGRLWLGKDGHIKGKVMADQAVIAGKVDDLLVVSSQASVQDSALVWGNVYCSAIEVAPQAVIHGVIEKHDAYEMLEKLQEIAESAPEEVPLQVVKNEEEKSNWF
ncbi:hypothetical protein COR50_19630 [Chitinophaga caeni]|uniref:Cell shape determination protein CcmA n=1 Tax=Chitinophaga caeni TaxID=2029983 RepID=A0A291QZ00_9BACT|nr:polymer-forming cytoskeletal protein [Chitinophaga caeni]ATL49206.1 hypothetical protein COR50_19630 [Chitinophaga caeni]